MRGSITALFENTASRKASEIEGMPLTQLIAGKHWESGNLPPSLHILSDKLTKRESFSNLLVKVSIGREHRWWELSGTPILDDNGAYLGIRGVGSDVTEQRESSEKIAYLARYDTLTGLPNRLMLTEALGDALRYADQWRTRCAFLMIDLDRFKAVNDSLGHQVGDKLLAEVSARLRGVLTDIAGNGSSVEPTWTLPYLLVDTTAAAAKLRQMMPAMKLALEHKGLAVGQLRIKVQQGSWR